MLFYEIQLQKVTVKIFLSHLIEKKNPNFDCTCALFTNLLKNAVNLGWCDLFAQSIWRVLLYRQECVISVFKGGPVAS